MPYFHLRVYFEYFENLKVDFEDLLFIQSTVNRVTVTCTCVSLGYTCRAREF